MSEHKIGGITRRMPIALDQNKVDELGRNANLPRTVLSRSLSTKNASGSTTSCKHSVFLSHAGEDKPFVRLLHNDLKRRQHSPFLDADPVSLPEGCDFPKTIFQAIETCQLVLVILSKNFVTKKWPMLELVAAWKCRNNKKSPMMIPVFYKLKVDEIKKDRLDSLYRIWSGISELNPDECREALKQLKHLSGIVNKGEEDDYVFARTVVERICNRVTPIKLWANDSMEMRDEFCEKLDWCMRQENDRSCTFLGMWGSSGAGKTWIAMALCRHLYGSYNGWVCLLDLSKKNDKLALASALYEELYGAKLERANEVEDVVGLKLGDFMKDKRLFLVLDNPILTEQGQRVVQFVLDICRTNCCECIVVITTPEEKFLQSLLVKRYSMDPKVTVKIMKVPSLTEDAAAKILYKTACPNNKKTWDTLDLPEQEAILTVCTTYLKYVEYNPRLTQLLGNAIRSRLGNTIEALTEWPKLEFDLSMLMTEQFQSMTANHLQAFCIDAALYDQAIQTTCNAICKWLGIIYGCQPNTVLTKLKEIRSNGRLLDWDGDDDDDDDDDDDGEKDEDEDEDDDDDDDNDDGEKDEDDDDDDEDDDDDPEINTDTVFAKFAMEQVLENPEKWGWFFYDQIAQEEELAARTDTKEHKHQTNRFVVPRPKDVKLIEKIALVGGRFKDVGEVLNLTRYSKAIALVISRCEKLRHLDVQWNKNIRVLEVDQCPSLREIEGLGDLTHLVCLRIVDCPKLALGRMCANMGLQLKLPRLQKLEIFNTAMTEAPNLQGCSKLQELILSGNEGLKCLPECWSGFPCLTKIDFSGNDSILELPDLSPLASSLCSLDISWCGKLTSVTCACIPSLTTLKTLVDMDGCPAIEISDSSFIQSLPNFLGEGLAAFQRESDDYGIWDLEDGEGDDDEDEDGEEEEDGNSDLEDF